jgi:transposase
MNPSLVPGLDRAKRNFTACLFGASGRAPRAPGDYPADRAGMEALLARLRPFRAAGARLVVGIEASASLDDNLLAFFDSAAARADGPLTLLRLDAAQVAGFRGPRPVRGKTDKTDARRTARFTLTFAAELDAFEADPQAQAMLRLVNERATLVEESVALKNRLQDRLIIAFPEFERVFPDPCSEFALHVLSQVPTAAHCARKRPATLAAMRARKGGHCVGPERAAKLLALARRSVASAVSEDDAETIQYLVQRLTHNARRIARIAQRLGDWIGQAPAAAPAPASPETPAPLSVPEQIRLADSLPGFAAVGAATIVLRCRGIARFPTGKALAAQLGACPDRNQTGASEKPGRLTHRGDRRTRAVLYLLALTACRHDPAMAFHQWRLLGKGLTKKQAVCAQMNRLARILQAVIRTRTPYDPARAAATARARHPDLWKIREQAGLPGRFRPRKGAQHALHAA